MHVEKHRISLYGRQFRKFEKETLEKLLISRKRGINKVREKKTFANLSVQNPFITAQVLFLLLLLLLMLLLLRMICAGD